MLTSPSVIEVFKDTLVPASLVGLLTKLAGLMFSGYMGGLVDKYPRLSLVRATIGAEKVSDALPDRPQRMTLTLSAVQRGQLRAVSGYVL